MINLILWAGIDLKGVLVNHLRFFEDIGTVCISGPKPSTGFVYAYYNQTSETIKIFGQMIHTEKTKTMVIDKTEETPTTITIQRTEQDVWAPMHFPF